MYYTTWHFPYWPENFSLTQVPQNLFCSAPEEETLPIAVNKEVKTNNSSSISQKKPKITTNHFVVLSHHCDHEIIDLLSKNIDFIKSNYNTILAECVPRNLEDHSAINYLNKHITRYVIKEEITLQLTQLLKSISAEEVKFLARKLNEGEDTNKFIDKRLEIFEKILKNISHPGFEQIAQNLKNDKLYNEEVLIGFKMMVNNFKLVKLYELALSKGLKIQGCEPENYIPHKIGGEERE